MHFAGEKTEVVTCPGSFGKAAGQGCSLYSSHMCLGALLRTVASGHPFPFPRWAGGSVAQWLGLLRTQRVPCTDGTQTSRSQGIQTGSIPVPEQQTQSWGDHEANLNDCKSGSQGQSSHGGDGHTICPLFI